jgi:hypothetical protein
VTTTLRKSNGDLFIDPETGRPDVVTGATKVDQELADLYLSDFDVSRNWGSSLSLSQLAGVTSIEQARAVLFLRLQQANDRILAKQAQDRMLTEEERISMFPEADVLADKPGQAVIFFSVANVGDGTVQKVVGQSFKPSSLKHVVPPPFTPTSKE